LFRHLFASFLKGNQKFLPKLQLSQQKQFSEQQLNVTGNLEIQENQNSPHQAARRLYRSLHNMHSEGANPLRDGMLLLRAPGTSLSIAKSFLRRRLYIPRQASFFLTANAESEPLHASRILLDDRCDGQGQPRALVHWCCSDRSLKALQAYLEALKETLEPAGIARIHPSDSLIHPGLNWQDRAYSLYHHMGATRMAATATQGVVDPNGQVFGVQGLYVSGTSVLPTGSASNPSFTALALTFRLGDHLLPDLPSS
jgi:choline dehydrogenase-like flavoprotein